MQEQVNTEAGDEQPSRPVPPPNRRRDKAQLSCNLCRRRKLKCDRNQPCESCVRRGLSLSCTYVPSTVNKPMEKKVTSNKSVVMHDRINQLEKLVVSLMNSVPDDIVKKASHQSTSPTEAPDEAPAQEKPNHVEEEHSLLETIGRLNLDRTETSYVEGSHWTAILDGIAELKESFEADEEELEPDKMRLPNETAGPELLFGRRRTVTVDDILATFPPKVVVDRYVSTYFSKIEMAPVILHTPTFINEYERFWKNPRDTPIMWIGLLSAMMCMGAFYQILISQEPGAAMSPSEAGAFMQSMTFKDNLVQCLYLAPYTKCPPYTIETMIHYLMIEMYRSEDSDIGIWVLLGILVRLAVRMGYHRDPKHFPQMSPFTAEMRRRVWTILVMFETVGAAQFGLPRMLRDVTSDTELPRHILDEDFDEHTTTLPTPQPQSHITPLSFILAKLSMVKIYGDITDMVTSIKPTSYADAMALDKRLDDAYNALPAALQWKNVTKLITDGNMLGHRAFMSMNFYKLKCILHRPFLAQARNDKRYSYSRTSCLEAAFMILELQLLIQQETQPEGRLFHDRWKVSSFVKQEYLFAAGILCVELDSIVSAERISTNKNYMDSEMKERIVLALNSVYPFWLECRATSKEAQRVVAALKLVLKKANGFEHSESSPGSEDLMQDMTDSRSTASGSSGPPPSYTTPYFDSVSSGIDPNTAGFLHILNSRGPQTPQIDNEISKAAQMDIDPFIGHDWDLWLSQFLQ